MRRIAGLLITFAVSFLAVASDQECLLQGRVVSIFDRITATNAVGVGACTLNMRAWRGERVHAQVVAWSTVACAAVGFSCSNLESGDGSQIESARVQARPVMEVEGVPDRLGDPDEAVIGTNGFLAVWVTVDVPRTVKPGLYRGTFTLRTKKGMRLDYPIALRVSNRVLPDKNIFYLDLWQNASAVARYHRVRPYSKEHYALLEPLFRELAAAGQKAVTVPICISPWGKGYLRDEFLPTVRDVRYSDGRCELDFSVFDEYVDFARSCGIGPQIHCYTILKFAHRFTYYYIDGESGEERGVTLDPDTSEWKAFWRPFLVQFERHVTEKGWLADTFIAIDEGDPKDQFTTRAFLKEVAPRLKFATAANKDGRLFKGLDADVYSQILWRDYCSAEFLATVPGRRAKGQITTFYVCTPLQKPNNWFSSPLVETEWIGLYAAAAGFDGFLRWAAFHWTDDPLTQATQGDMPAGEVHFLYPNAQASTRWEILRDAIEDYRKIAALREEGGLSSALKQALKGIDYETLKAEDAEACRKRVESVLSEL